MIFADIIGGFQTFFADPFAIYFVFLAAFVGMVFGALPGLTAAAAIAMMLPILIVYNDVIGGLSGLAFLYVVGKSGRYGGSIAAILFNTPELQHLLQPCRTAIPCPNLGEQAKL